VCPWPTRRVGASHGQVQESAHTAPFQRTRTAPRTMKTTTSTSAASAIAFTTRFPTK
jgi:hypothetical protein